MQHTSLKQVKFNRGQVTEMLSERVDMGLQNACGTVYNNTYINRYGQLENTPVIKLASTGGAESNISILTLFDTGDDEVLPVGVDRTGDTDTYCGWKYTPSLTVQFSVSPPVSQTGMSETVTKTCSRNPSKDYTSGGVTYYAWNCSYSYKKTLVQHGAAYTYVLKTDYVYTTTPYPTKNSSFTIHITTATSGTQITSKSITTVAPSTILYTKSATPSANADVYDAQMNYFGTVYTGSAETIMVANIVYYRDSSLDTTRATSARLVVFSPLSKKDNTILTDLDTPIASQNLVSIPPTKAYQFGANVVLYDQNTQPILFSIVKGSNGWYNPTLTVKEDYFTGSFDNVFVRGININPPLNFAVPTSGRYKVVDDQGITTKKVVTIQRVDDNGGAFVQALVGQVIDCPQLSGAVQVRSVQDGNNLTAYVLSPLITSSDTSVTIYIDFSSTNNAKWLFGYERAFSSTNGWPDSICYANQRLIFGGNDNYGNLMSASRIGVINDFDPNDGTESDAFSASIAASEKCRIVAMVKFNDELRFACTNGEYAVSLNALTPTGIIQSGFALRSQIGAPVGSAICDCGGLTAYVAKDEGAIYGTRFDLLKNQYSPISLTSQTSGVVNDCINLLYLRNRRNQEGNLLVGLNRDGSMFGLEIDINSGLVGAFRMLDYDLEIPDTVSLEIKKIASAEYALWGIASLSNFDSPENAQTYIVRFAREEFFNFPCGLTVPTGIAQFINQDGIHFRGLIRGAKGLDLLTVKTITDNGDGTSTISFGDSAIDAGLVVAGFLRQADWRSVEVSLGMTTREINKKIVKLEGVIEPQPFWDYSHSELNVVPQEDLSKFFDLLNTKKIATIENQFIVEKPLDIFAEDNTIIWRRAFDNPEREKYYGFTSIVPFLIKSLTATVEFDEVC